MDDAARGTGVGRQQIGRRRALAPVVAAGILVLASLGSFPSPAHDVQAAGLLPLHVSGNSLVDSNGQTVVLHGVNRSGSEYACIQGWGIFDGPNLTNDDSQVPLMKAWGVNEVNIGINEDCWLNTNMGTSPYGGATYINAIVHETQTLESNNMYPVISLFWEAPGTTQATDQIAMPDAAHATALWQSVANTFKGDPDVIFRLKEEPYPDTNSDTTAAWQCWLNGGSYCSEGYPAVGMQSLINTIRSTGATNVIQVPGVQYANTMDQFLTYAPSDSQNNLMGVVDVYPNGNICGSTNCYDAQYAPVIAKYPFMAGEFGQSVDGSDCTTTGVDALMSWFDAHGAGYSGWSWDTWGACLQLISDYSTGAPNGNWGSDYKSHLLSLQSATPTATPTGDTATPTATPTSTPTLTPTPTAPTATFLSTSASPASVARGQGEKLAGSLELNRAMTGVTVSYTVVNSVGTTVVRYNWTRLTFKANVARAFSVTWKVPLKEPVGTYRFAIRVTNGGSTVYGADMNAGTFSVT